MGSEQGKTRPVVVVSEDALNELLPVVNVLPLTSRKPGRRVYPNEALIPAGRFGLTSDSIVLAYQIRTLDKQRLLKRLGLVNDNPAQESILEVLKFQLGFD
jgi:mRNA interferase MazF